MKNIKRILSMAIVIVIGFIVWRVSASYSELGVHYFHVVMKSSADDVANLYFDTGQGLSEKDSIGVRIYGDQQFHDYQFQLPHAAINQFRFDPLLSTGSVTLACMEVVNSLGHRIRLIDFRQLKAGHQIRSIDIQGQEATIVTEDKANDPQVWIQLDSPLTFGYFNKGFFFFCASIIGESLGLFCLISGFLWVWYRWPDRTSRTVMVIALFVLGWRYWIPYQQATTFYLQVSFRSSVEGYTQLFYDRGWGFNESDSVKKKAWVDSRFNSLRFQLPRGTFYNFRFDPFTTSGTMYLKNMEIINWLGHRQQAIDLHHWQPANQIQKLDFRNNELVIVTEEGVSDPHIALKLSNPLKLDRPRTVLTASLMGRAALELIIVATMATMMLIAIKKIKIKIKDTAIGQIKLFWLMDALYLLASLFLFYTYFKGKWRDTITFIKSLFNG